MKSIKRTCLFLLCTLLLALLLPSLAGAADSDFQITNGVLTKYTGPGGKVVVPEGVTEIADRVFDGNDKITSVVLPEGVTRIGNSAFYWCSSLTDIVIPESVTSIGNSAFTFCYNLTSVTLPAALETLGENVFEGCSSLTSLEDKSGKFMKTVDGIVYSLDGPKMVIVLPSVSSEVRIADGVTEIPAWLFTEKNQITSVVIPASVTTIGSGAFWGCASLTSVVIPEGVTTIGDSAFESCKNLTSITLPSTLETLGESVFSSCTNLTDVVDNSGKFLKIADGIVYSADGTQIIAVLASVSGDIRIADGVTEISNYLFENNSKITGVVIPESVTRIGDGAFSLCENLTSVTLPSALETLGESVFAGCVNLTGIEDPSGKFLKTIDGIVYSPDGTRLIAVLASASGEIRIAAGVTEIPGCLFQNNQRITGVIIPEGVTAIRYNAFEGCTALTGIVIPEGVTEIEYRAFYRCESLTSITLPSTLETLGANVFEDCRNLTNIEDKSGKFLKIVDGIIYSADGTEIVQILPTVSGEVRIAEGVTAIPAWAFNGNSQITAVVVPEGVTSIGDGAFSWCENLTSVTLPSTLETLGANVFEGCRNLTNIEDKSGAFLKTVDGIVYSADGTRIIAALASVSGEVRIAEGVTEIPAWMFNGNSQITAVVIPEGVTAIGDGTFSWCENMTSVTLPSTLETLGESVFDGCINLNNIEDKSGKILKTVDGIVYSADGTQIIAVLTSASGDIRIAEGVTKIPHGLFNNNSRFHSIVIPEGVTVIGDHAFSYAENLTSVTLPSTLKSLGEGAFEGCRNLADIEDKSGKFLKIADGIVYSADGTQIIAVLTSASGDIRIAEGVTEIPDGLFEGNDRITSVVIPDGVTRIGNYAFNLCSSLIDIVIPESVTSIGEEAFHNCNSLTSIVVPEGVTSIGNAAFSWCYSLTSITLPSTLETLGEGVLEGNENLASIEDKSGKFLKVVDGIVYSADSMQIIVALVSASGEIHIAEGTTEIPAWLFAANDRITAVVIPEGVTTIGDGAFTYCENLTSVTLPSTLENWGEGVLEGCSNLTSFEDKSGKFVQSADGIIYSADGAQIIAALASVSGEVRIAEGVTKIPNALFLANRRITGIVIPDGVTDIGEFAFYVCTSLTSIVIPESVTSIGNYAFYGCTAMTGIVLPEGVTSIGNGAFSCCRALANVVIPESVTSIGSYAFNECESLTSITLPANLKTLGEGAFAGCRNLTDIEEKSGKFLKTVDGIVYSADGTRIIAALASASGDIRIAEGVTEIPAYLFQNNNNITGVVIPEGVTSIGNGAFNCCNSLTSVTLPSTLETLGEGVFDGCGALASIEDKSGKFLKVADGIVYSADGTRIIAVLASVSGEIRIAEGVTEIPAYLFQNNNNITGVVIPEGVTSIGNGAFNCCNSLTSVTLPSTLETLGEGVFDGCGALASIEDKSGKFLKVADGIVYTADGTRIITALASASGEIHIAEGVTEIPQNLFWGNNQITAVVIPEGVTSIGWGAFSMCDNLTSVTLPSTLVTLEEDVFTCCVKLASIVDKSGKFLKTVDGIVYSADGTRIIAVLTSAIGEIHIAEGVTEIPQNLFWGNKRVTAVVIPEGVTCIWHDAFKYCANLTSVTLPSTLKTLYNAFRGCDNLTSIVDKSGTFLKTVDGIVYSADGTQIIAVLASASGEIHIAEGVTEIPTSMFEGNKKITYIVLPESVTSIWNLAFGECTALTGIEIPEGVTKIWWGAFSGCEKLTSVTLPSTLNDIGDEAFPASTIIRSEPDTYAHTWALENGYTWQPAGQAEIKVMKLPAGLKSIQQEAFRGSAAESIVLPDGCTEIGAKAFADCAMLRRVEIPASVAVIAEDAFEGCSHELVIVTPKGSAAESFAQAHGISVTYAGP